MAIILTQNSMDNTNIDGARAEYFNSGMRDGIVKGAFNEGTFATLASNQISFDTCELRISGHRVVVEEAWTRTFSTKPKTPMRYALIGQIIVGEDSSVQFELFPQLASTAPIKNNLFRQKNGAGTYQVEIGRFTLNTDGNIIDVTRTLDIITGSKGEDLDGTINIGKITTNTLEPEMEAEVDVEQRYDAEQKKVLTDFNFNIPRGQGIEKLDTELSELSTNAVQNSAIAKAVNDLQTEKADKADLENKADKSEIPDISGKADLTNPEQTITAKVIILDPSENDDIVRPAITINGHRSSIEFGTDVLLHGFGTIVGHYTTYSNPNIPSVPTLAINAADNLNFNADEITLNARQSGNIILLGNTRVYDNLVVDGTITSNGENVLTKSSLLELAYPVGSIYMSINNVSPASFLGGTWEQLPAGYALWTASSGAGGTIPAGLPNITGEVFINSVGNGDSGWNGALRTNETGGGAGGTSYNRGQLYFDANKSNSIYGSSTTVQPPAYKVYVWKRTA